jgi:hypothetical protein
MINVLSHYLNFCNLAKGFKEENDAIPLPRPIKTRTALKRGVNNMYHRTVKWLPIMLRNLPWASHVELDRQWTWHNGQLKAHSIMLASLVNDYYASWNDMRINVWEHGNNKATFDMIMSCEHL